MDATGAGDPDTRGLLLRGVERGVPPLGVPPGVDPLGVPLGVPPGVEPRGVPPRSAISVCRCLAHSSAARAQSVPTPAMPRAPDLPTAGDAAARGVRDGVLTTGVGAVAGVRDIMAGVRVAGVRVAGVRGVAPGHTLRGVGWYDGVAAGPPTGVVM